MTAFKAAQEKAKAQGAKDALAGKTIEAFFDMKLPRHTERLRAAYEVGWRAAITEYRKKAKEK